MEAKKILIVEDDVMVAEICAKHLRHKGYDVYMAFNGLEALEKLHEMTPDLILLDLGLPKISGVEFFQCISTDRGYPKYPVLVLTGQIDYEPLFKEVKVDGFMTKPFSISELLNQVESILFNQYWRNNASMDKRILIVDKDKENLSQIAHFFSEAGFKVEISQSGISALEKIMRNPPYAVLMNSNMKDISVNLTIEKLQTMTKTKDVQYLLYSSKNLDPVRLRTGNKSLHEAVYPQDLLKVIQGIREIELSV